VRGYGHTHSIQATRGAARSPFRKGQDTHTKQGNDIHLRKLATRKNKVRTRLVLFYFLQKILLPRFCAFLGKWIKKCHLKQMKKNMSKTVCKKEN
jgi:hypothetical protein